MGHQKDKVTPWLSQSRMTVCRGPARYIVDADDDCEDGDEFVGVDSVDFGPALEETDMSASDWTGGADAAATELMAVRP
jgi:hypothetical protein